MRVQLYGTKQLEAKLMKKSAADFTQVANKNARDIYRRAVGPSSSPGGTPVDSTELRTSARVSGDEFGYGAAHGPHVEYGRRTRGGGYVPGQYFLKTNTDLQRPIYKEDLRAKLRE
jgi:hypothetical protein